MFVSRCSWPVGSRIRALVDLDQVYRARSSNPDEDDATAPKGWSFVVIAEFSEGSLSCLGTFADNLMRSGDFATRVSHVSSSTLELVALAWHHHDDISDFP